MDDRVPPCLGEGDDPSRIVVVYATIPDSFGYVGSSFLDRARSSLASRIDVAEHVPLPVSPLASCQGQPSSAMV